MSCSREQGFGRLAWYARTEEQARSATKAMHPASLLSAQMVYRPCWEYSRILWRSRRPVSDEAKEHVYNLDGALGGPSLSGKNNRPIADAAASYKAASFDSESCAA